MPTTAENPERAGAEVKGPIPSILVGVFFSLVIGGVTQSGNALAQGRPAFALVFSLVAPTAILLNVRYVVPVWCGRPFRETALLFAGSWLVTALIAVLVALPLWYFGLDLFPLDAPKR